MSAKSRKSSSRTATRTTTQAVHVDTNSSLGDLSSSIASPTFLSRRQEKEHLSGLNDRLASYIDKVRHLEQENNHLTLQIRDFEVVEKREKDGLRNAYEAELADTRRLLDSTAKEKAKIQIDTDKARSDFSDLKSRTGRLEKELKASEDGRLEAESIVQDLQARNNTAENRRKHAEDEAKRIRVENADVARQLDTAKKQLEEETLLRVDLENRLQSLREELEFNKNLYSTELEEFRRKRQVEMTTVSKQIESDYDAKLQAELRRMRDASDAQIAFSRHEVEEMYTGKLEDANNLAQHYQHQANEAREEMLEYRQKMRDMDKSDRDHNAIVAGLNEKIKKLESTVNFLRDETARRQKESDEIIAQLRVEINQMMIDYQDLMDTKIKLDFELAAYQKLLEGEEKRLRLTPQPSPASAMDSPSRRGVKRKRIFESMDERINYKDSISQSAKVNSHADGDVEISDHDADGLFVRMHNKGDEEVSIGGWILKSMGVSKEVQYKFHPRQTLKAGKTITIWSSCSGQSHSPPSDLLMKNQDWPGGDSIRSVLLDSDEVEIAYRESKTGLPFTIGENGTDPDQRCSIM